MGLNTLLVVQGEKQMHKTILLSWAGSEIKYLLPREAYRRREAYWLSTPGLQVPQHGENSVLGLHDRRTHLRSMAHVPGPESGREPGVT